MKKITQLFALAAVIIIAACTPTPKAGSITLTETLTNDAWEAAQWISVVDAPTVTGKVHDGTRSADGANWFVSTLKNEQQITEAKWMTTGLGVYDLYVNGTLIGEEVLKPGFTHWQKTRRSFTYDITSALNTDKGAENVLSAQVTPGWWADKIITPAGTEGMLGKKCAFRAVLELTFADGTKKLYGTDTENWKAGIAGPVTHAAIFDGEEYDARIQPGYATPEKLSKPEVNTEFNGEILPTNGAEIYFRKDLALAPVKAYTWKGVTGATEEAHGKVVITREFTDNESLTVLPGENLVVDFGQNSSAVPTFVFHAKEGTVLTCLPGELLNDGNGAKERGMDGPEGSVHRLNLRIPDTGMILKYTFADTKSPVAYVPRTTFFGYRYVTITATDEVTIQHIESLPVTSITQAQEIGHIETGDASINQLISNTYWGQISNYLSVPTDCPQRNERLGWTADTQVFAETGSFFADTRSFFWKWMRDMRDSQSQAGGYPSVAPFAQYGNETMRLGWADAGIIVPWTIWKQFGDKQIIEENWASMDKFMTYVHETKYDYDTHKEESNNHQYADWLSYEALESCIGLCWGPNGLLPDAISYYNYLSASYWALDATYMADMAAATGRDADRYRQMAEDAKAFLREKFLNADGTFKVKVFNTMQTSALFALKNGLVEGKAKENTLARLRKNFEEHGNCLQTGFLGTSILMSTLTENGMIDLAYELLFQRKNPSWLYSIDNGATTIWERWNSYMLDKGMGPKGMNSFDHYAYGCVCEWIWETAAGISSDPAAPGFKRIIMKPVPDKRLGYVNAEYQSAAGLIKSAWHYEGDQCIWNFTVPEGATAIVTLPGQTEAKEYQAGSYTLNLN